MHFCHISNQCPESLSFTKTFPDVSAVKNYFCCHQRIFCIGISKQSLNAQIIGFSVYSHDAQEPLGLLEAVDDSTENILFVVKKADGETLLLPCNEDFIDMIDPQQRRIVMSLPEGLLDL